MMSKKQIQDKITWHEEAITILEEVLNTDIPGKMGRPLGSTIYTEEQLKFIKEFKDILSMRELVVKYNKKFGTDMSQHSRALYNLIDRRDMK